MTLPRKTIPPIPPSPEAKRHARATLPCSTPSDGGKYVTPQEPKTVQTLPSQRVEDEVSSVFIPVEDLYWIKDSLHNLRREKADHTLLSATIRTFEEKLDGLNIRLKDASHCKKQAEFADLKEAVNSWRSFFRNTVAVGSIGALFVIGGWLWQYYALVDQITKTSGDVTQTSHSVSILQEDYAKYKQDQFAEGLKISAENDARFVHLEYKLLTAISKLSQGQKVDAPIAPPLETSDRKN